MLLEGIKVLEIAEWVAATSAMAILSDWGADVIKVERPQGGDGLRGLTTLEGVPLKGMNWYFQQMNRNKKSIVINLLSEEGRQVLYKLVAQCDVLATNFLPPALEKLGITYEKTRKINPRIIYAHFSGYGEAGPEKDRPGYDHIAFWARSGILTKLGSPGAEAVYQRPGMGDEVGGLTFAGAVAAALYARERTGKSQLVNVCLYHCGVWVLAMDYMLALNQGEEIPRRDRKATENPLRNNYKTRDEVWVLFHCVQSDRYWPQICKALGIERLQNDPKFNSHTNRAKNNVELISILDTVIGKMTYAELADALNKAGEIVFDRARTLPEVIGDPQTAANDFFNEVEDPSGHKFRLVRSPMGFPQDPPKVRAPAPEFGQHTEEVLLGYGYSWEDIGKLKERGIIP